MAAVGIRGGDLLEIGPGPGGRYCIMDLRRDVHPVKKAFVYFSTRPLAMRKGLVSSLNAAYTVSEIRELLRHSPLGEAEVQGDFFGLTILYNVIVNKNTDNRANLHQNAPPSERMAAFLCGG